MNIKNKPGLPRREFLGAFSRAGLFGAIASSPLSSFAGNADAYAAHPEKGHIFLTAPYLQSPTESSMCIRWITNRFSYSWVEYGEGNNLDKKAHSCTEGLIDAYNRVNCINLYDLKPATTYSYRVLSKEIADFEPYEVTYGETISSDILSFTTQDPKSKEATWLVLNDIHDRPNSFGELIRFNNNEPFDYMFLNGDMFNFQTDEQQLIDHLIAPCTEHFASQKPMMFIRGNHETRGKYARDIKQYFSNFGQGQYFTFQLGPVYTITLDTGEDKPDDHPVYAGIVDFDDYRKEQARWLEKELKSEACRKAPYRVVMMHIPPYYSGDWHGTMHCRELFVPLFNKYKIDLVLSGHTHTYGVHPPVAGEHNFPIIIGGGPSDGKRTLIRVKADLRNLNVKMWADDGSEVGNYTVKRS